MLSMSAMGGGQGEYYLGLAQEDYYLEGGEPLGHWWGDGAERLGLAEDSIVGKEQFRNLYSGHHPETEKRLVQNAGKEDRQPGWDLTFSAPKSVSVAWSQAEDLETRAEFQAAHQQAVEKALSYLQDSAAQVRTGHAGANREECGLVVSIFEHATSRAIQAQLHSHSLIHNIGVTEDGATRTLWSKSLYQHKMAAGAIYRLELAHQLQQRLEVGIERGENDFGFEVVGVGKDLMDAQSTRRKEIEASLKERGLSSAKASEVAAKDTREVKSHIARSELFTNCQEEGKKFGFKMEDVLGQGSQSELAQVKGEILRDHQSQALVEAKLTEQRSYFRERDAVRFVAEQAVIHGLSADDVIKTLREHLTEAAQPVQIAREQCTEKVYTTKAMIELEEGMLQKVRESEKELGFGLSTTRVEAAIKSTEKRNGFEMNREQHDAVAHIVGGDSRIRAVTGMAGTGKTTMLEAAKVAWEAKGYDIKGTAIAWTATNKLAAETGMDGTAIAKLLFDVQRSQETFSPAKALEDWKAYVAKNATSKPWLLKTNFNLAKAKELFQKFQPENPLTKNTVLVVDEAGMVGTAQMAKLIEETQKVGAKLILVGDADQLQSIDPGGAFRSVTKELGPKVELTEIFRQDEEWMREAVHHFAEGNADHGLKAYAEHGQLHIGRNRSSAETKLITQWKKDGGVEQPQDRYIMASTNEDVRKLNLLAQSSRYNEGKLGPGVKVDSGPKFYEGDRVCFTARHKCESAFSSDSKTRVAANLATGKKSITEVFNGDFATVDSVNRLTKTLTVVLDDGRRAKFSLNDFDKLKLGYAATVHKSQGATVDKVYVLAGDTMQNRELTYVQMSRSRAETHIFLDKPSAGKELEDITRSMSRSDAKELAIERADKLFMAENQQREERALEHQVPL